MSEITKILTELTECKITVGEAEKLLGSAVVSDLNHTKVDNLRSSLKGHPEVIYGSGKTVEQLLDIAEGMKNVDNVIFTRLSEQKARALKERYNVTYSKEAGLIVLNPKEHENPVGNVLVCCGGTSDIYAAEEAAYTAWAMGSKVTRLYDVGVAGIHRLLSHIEDIRSATVIVACAGMEGALPSVVAGLTDKPVIAVPTSVGYGASFNGVAALLGMLNSCSSGVSVVNIDNGFGAGYQAALINSLLER